MSKLSADPQNEFVVQDLLDYLWDVHYELEDMLESVVSVYSHITNCDVSKDAPLHELIRNHGDTADLIDNLNAVRRSITSAANRFDRYTENI